MVQVAYRPIMAPLWLSPSTIAYCSLYREAVPGNADIAVPPMSTGSDQLSDDSLFVEYPETTVPHAFRCLVWEHWWRF